MENLIYWGGAVKALGDGKIGGPLVRFTDPSSTDFTIGGWDATSEYFTKSTNFFLDPNNTLPVLYDHGLDGTLKRRQLGRAKVEIKDAELWAEVQLELRDEYEKKIYDMAEKGKLGWSSGPAQHAVAKKSITLADGKSTVQEITEWMIAEASLTPTPCEVRCQAITMKAYVEQRHDLLEIDKPEARGVKGMFTNYLAEQTPSYWQLSDALREVMTRLAQAASVADLVDGSLDVSAKVNEALMEFAAMAAPVILSQINDYIDSPTEYFYIKGNPFNSVIDSEGKPRAGMRFADHLDSVRAAVSGVINRAKKVQEVRAKDLKAGRVISTANANKLQSVLDALDGLDSVRDEIKGLIAMSTPKDEKSISEEISNLLLEHQRRKFTLTKASIA